MNAPAPISPTTGLVFDAVAEAASIAEAYARNAVEFALIRDARGAAYSLNCAAKALASAASTAQALRPAPQNGGAV
ncbi:MULTISPECIES: hypothetical protein [unclassified Methylobacterium]|uniref:hypothetical protein n=1 Tax=unclassified Methylobacterium TaxID=2615210 RepID=UPI001FBA6947|nr:MULTISPECIES: hypothetical protein [unclassified Methylobacterium]MCJ2093956.1 hypothetical protein [Methylobacterium sp. J-072]MCJ2142936.1 hypothetical protein [Methylobacterium sp. E-066]